MGTNDKLPEDRSARVRGLLNDLFKSYSPEDSEDSEDPDDLAGVPSRPLKPSPSRIGSIALEQPSDGEEEEGVLH